MASRTYCIGNDAGNELCITEVIVLWRNAD